MKMQIENNFKYHAPTEEQVGKYNAIREKAKELAHLIGKECPRARERSLAITKLEEAVMWANASIARHGGVEQSNTGGSARSNPLSSTTINNANPNNVDFSKLAHQISNQLSHEPLGMSVGSSLSRR